MDWFFDNFQILALVALAFASWLKHRSDAKAAEREQKEPRQEMDELPDWFEDEETWQVPRPQEPPPLVRRVEAMQPPPLYRQAPPPVPEMAGNAELQRQEELHERLREMREKRESSARQAKQAKEARQAREARQPKLAREARLPGEKPVFAFKSRLRASLHQRSQIRQAVLLREILGPPVALRRGR